MMGGREERASPPRWRLSRLGAWLVAAIAIAATGGISAVADPTPEEYVQKVGGDAQIIPAGMLTIDGHKVICGQRPTVLDNSLDDFGAAYQGFLILNPKLLAKIKSTPVKLWVHAHE